MDETSSFIHPIHQDEMSSAESGNHPRRVVTAQLALRRHHRTSAVTAPHRSATTSDPGAASSLAESAWFRSTPPPKTWTI
jgi:hypothetical protein